MLHVTLQKQYKELAHMITEQAKKTGKMRRYDYKMYVLPFATILRTKPISEQQLLSGLYRAKIVFV